MKPKIISVFFCASFVFLSACAASSSEKSSDAAPAVSDAAAPDESSILSAPTTADAPPSHETDKQDTPTPSPHITGQDEDIPSITPDAQTLSPANILVRAMGNGWNLGNTMEAVGDWCDHSPTGYETCWGQPVTTYEMIAGIKACGFHSVRIPVAWSNMMSKDGSYHIDEAYFERVDEIVGYVLDNEMYAIINIHWDGGWWENFGDPDAAVREETLTRYTAMWTQIAEHYKDFPDRLILESANEELTRFSNNISVAESYELVNRINQRFVDIVRASGGGNAERFLLIAGYNTDIVNTCDEKFSMPKDTVSDHLLISVHYYTPSTYCIADDKANSWGYKDSWGTDTDKAEMRRYLEKMKKFSDQGYGVIIGEYGVTKKNMPDGTREYKEGTAQFYEEMVRLCKELGYCPILWDTGDAYNRKECRFAYEPLERIYAN